MPSRRPIQTASDGGDTGDPLQALQGAKAIGPEPVAMMRGEMPLGPGAKIGGKALEDLLGEILQTPSKAAGLPSSFRVSSYDPEESTIRMFGADSGAPYEVTGDDLAKLMHTNAVERQGQNLNQGLSLQSLIKKLLTKIPQ